MKQKLLRPLKAVLHTVNHGTPAQTWSFVLGCGLVWGAVQALVQLCRSSGELDSFSAIVQLPGYLVCGSFFGLLFGMMIVNLIGLVSPECSGSGTAGFAAKMAWKTAMISVPFVLVWAMLLLTSVAEAHGDLAGGLRGYNTLPLTPQSFSGCETALVSVFCLVALSAVMDRWRTTNCESRIKDWLLDRLV